MAEYNPFDNVLAVVDNAAKILGYSSAEYENIKYPERELQVSVPVEMDDGTVQVFDGPRLVAEHERATERGSVTLVLDHYLEVLAYKPGALPGATALVQARRAGVFTATHERYWAAAKARYGDKTGTQALVEALLLHRQYHQYLYLLGVNLAHL